MKIKNIKIVLVIDERGYFFDVRWVEADILRTEQKSKKIKLDDLTFGRWLNRNDLDSMEALTMNEHGQQVLERVAITPKEAHELGILTADRLVSFCKYATKKGVDLKEYAIQRSIEAVNTLPLEMLFMNFQSH